MEILNHISHILHYAISFVIIISILVFIHEWGHFIVARLCGVKIDEFSIGFGKEIWSRTDKKGTRWKISLLPFGGFVKMHGDETEASTPDVEKLNNMSEEEKAISFYYKPLWKKGLIVLAGPAANFILAIVIFTSIYMSYGKLKFDAPPIAQEVMKDGAAEKIGMKAGDVILELDNKKIEHFSDLQQIIRLSPLETLEVKYKRGDEVITSKISPKFQEIDDALGNKVKVGMIGISAGTMDISKKDFVPLGFVPAVTASVEEVYKQCQVMLKGLSQIINGVRSTKELGGPIKIMEYSGQSTSKISDALACYISGDGKKDCGDMVVDGLLVAFVFMAMISTMLGLMNLFPIPVLDGGHLLFYLIEAVTRKPMAGKFQEWSYRIGFSFLIGMMIYVTFNDIISFVNRYLS